MSLRKNQDLWQCRHKLSQHGRIRISHKTPRRKHIKERCDVCDDNQGWRRERGTLQGRKCLHISHNPEDAEPKRRPEATKNHLFQVDYWIAHEKSEFRKERMGWGKTPRAEDKAFWNLQIKRKDEMRKNKDKGGPFKMWSALGNCLSARPPHLRLGSLSTQSYPCQFG